jgi:DNA-binding transcriptional MerR regulator
LVDGYRISELAERSGFSASTLRFYEQFGLLPTADRSSGGYRLYDEATVRRLEFIAGAKRFGLPLEQIRELVGLWDGGACGPVRQRLQPLLVQKINEVDSQASELTAFSAALSQSVVALELHTPDGPCGPDCGCLAPPDAPEQAPIVCTLAAIDQPARAEEWSQLLDAATSTQEVPGGVRLRFVPDPALAGRIAELAAREQQCCRFFDFILTLAPDETVLEVRAPAGAQELALALFDTRGPRPKNWQNSE